MKEKVIRRLERISSGFEGLADQASWQAVVQMGWGDGNITEPNQKASDEWNQKSDKLTMVAVRYSRRANRKRGHACERHLKYEAELGAPGIGYSYKCTKCGRAHWTMNKKDFTPFSAINPEDVIGDSSYFM
jgi:hypothetical protein